MTPNPAPTSKVEPIIVAPEMLAVPVTANVEAAVRAPLNVLAPANVWVPVVTVPEAPVPAAGILNVCVEPEDTILNSVPDVPVANVCVVFVSPLRDDMPAPTTLNVTVPAPCVIERLAPATNDLYSNAFPALFMPST